MAIITISRGSFSKGKEVAEKVAAQLGYDCISREVLLDASDRFHIPEVKLIRATTSARPYAAQTAVAIQATPTSAPTP